MHIVTGDEMYAIDRKTMEEVGLPGLLLMENAGQAVVRKLEERIGKDDEITVLAGAGNNGGDGIVIARLLQEKGYRVQLWLIPPDEKVKGDAEKHLLIYKKSGHLLYRFAENEARCLERIKHSTVIVDAMLGIGVKGGVREPYRRLIEKVNEVSARVISVDVPSGVPADGGIVEEAVQADETYTLQCPKIGLFHPGCRKYYGKWDAVSIGIPNKVIKGNAEKRLLWQKENVTAALPCRPFDAHKGTFGRGLVIAGSRTMTGAAILAAEAALRGGAGLVTCAVPEDIHPIVAGRVIEATFQPLPTEGGLLTGELPFSLSAYRAVAAGPGIGRDKGSDLLIRRLLEDAEQPLILDADALFHVKDLRRQLQERKAPTILTPHPGEMARLADVDVREVQSRRFQIAQQFAECFGVFLVLKGPYTVVAAPDRFLAVNPTGNPALAKGGSGDVLTGLMLAFIMQHEHLRDAICNAVFIHGMAADLLIEQGHSQMDVVATDVIAAIGNVLARL